MLVGRRLVNLEAGAIKQGYKERHAYVKENEHFRKTDYDEC